MPNTPLYDEIQELAAQYPVRRSAIMPALHAAQKQYGWLSPEALQEVADALDLTPAYCQAVASFYDMYHLEPIGRHMVEVCTNISCALVGAQQVLEAFEEELDIRAGRHDRGRRVHAQDARVRRRLRLGHRRQHRPSLPRAGEARGRTERSWRSSVAANPIRNLILEHASDRDLKQLSEYEAVGGYGVAPKGARDRPGRSGRKPARLRSARPRRSRLPDRAQGQLPPQAGRDGEADLPHGQRGRVRAGHVQGPRDHVRDPARTHRGHRHRQPRDRRARSPSSTSAGST